MHRVEHCRHEDLTPTVEDGSVGLVVTDPPYYGVKGSDWDNQWASADAFLDWIDQMAQEWRRMLSQAGSLYCFASPQLADGVAAVLRRHFRVLAHVVWVKPRGMFQKTSLPALRTYFPRTERILFCEHMDAGSTAAGAGCWASERDRLRGEAFEPLRAYLAGERDASGITQPQIREAIGSSRTSSLPGHWFGRSQWFLPKRRHYEALQRLAPGRFARPWDDLEAERRQLEDGLAAAMAGIEYMRRPFEAADRLLATDVWDFEPVPPRGDHRHPCAKPLAMMEHIVRTSSREGDLVFDGFCGSGVSGLAAVGLGRRFLGCDADPRWASRSRALLEAGGGDVQLSAPTSRGTRIQNPNDGTGQLSLI